MLYNGSTMTQWVNARMRPNWRVLFGTHINRLVGNNGNISPQKITQYEYHILGFSDLLHQSSCTNIGMSREVSVIIHKKKYFFIRKLHFMNICSASLLESMPLLYITDVVAWNNLPGHTSEGGEKWFNSSVAAACKQRTFAVNSHVKMPIYFILTMCQSCSQLNDTHL